MKLLLNKKKYNLLQRRIHKLAQEVHNLYCDLINQTEEVSLTELFVFHTTATLLDNASRQFQSLGTIFNDPKTEPLRIKIYARNISRSS